VKRKGGSTPLGVIVRFEGMQHFVRYFMHLQSHFHIPNWVTKLTGFSGTQYSHEFSQVDPIAHKMALYTRNLNAASFLRVDEKLTYVPHPDDHNKTLLVQEASVSVNLPAFTDYCERTFLGIYSTNAVTGRRGVEWVINHLKQEYNEITAKVSTEMHEISDKMLHALKANNNTQRG